MDCVVIWVLKKKEQSKVLRETIWILYRLKLMEIPENEIILESVKTKIKSSLLRKGCAF